MAFLSAGHVPGEGPYQANVDKGIRWVLAQQRADGLFAASADYGEMYALLLVVLLVSVTGLASRTRYAVAIASVVIVASILYLAVPLVRAVIDDTVFAKAKSWSAAQRFGS